MLLATSFLLIFQQLDAMLWVHSWLTAAVFLFRREAAAYARVSQVQEDDDVQSFVGQQWQKGLFGSMSGILSQAKEHVLSPQRPNCTSATQSDKDSQDSKITLQVTNASRTSASKWMNNANSAERWRDRVFILMFVWVMIEDVLGDMCGFSLVDLDRDGYGGGWLAGGKSASILSPADTQPLIGKESVDILLRLVASWCQQNLFELFGRRDILVVLVGPDKAILGLIGAVMGGAVVAASAFLRAPKLQVCLHCKHSQRALLCPLMVLVLTLSAFAAIAPLRMFSGLRLRS